MLFTLRSVCDACGKTGGETKSKRPEVPAVNADLNGAWELVNLSFVSSILDQLDFRLMYTFLSPGVLGTNAGLLNPGDDLHCLVEVG